MTTTWHYFELNADLLNRLDRFLNNSIRFVFNLRKYGHVYQRRPTELFSNSHTQTETNFKYSLLQLLLPI